MIPPDCHAFLRTVSPFDILPDTELQLLAETLSLERFYKEQVLLRKWQKPSYLYIIVEGVVEEQDQEGGVGRYDPLDSFDARALIEGRSQHHFVAKSDGLCYRLPAQPFLALVRDQPSIREFYTAQLSRRLDALVTLQQQREAASFMMARIGEGNLHPPTFVNPDMTLHEAVRHMKERNTTALLVRRDAQVGIFTSRDVREQAVLAQLPSTTPIGELAHYQLVTLDKEDLLCSAFVVMTQQAIRHIVITHQGHIVGLLEQADLLNYLINHSYLIAKQLEHAHTIEQLQEAAKAIPRMIQALQQRGVKPRYMARLVTDLNRKLLRNLFNQLMPSDLQQNSCFIVMGSEGRGEQLLATDQDNAIVLADSVTCPELANYTAAITTALVRFGYPRCPGNIMVANPEWAKPLAAYKLDLYRWIYQPDETAFMKLAIFYDAHAIAGQCELLDELRHYLFYLLRDNQLVLRHFAKATLSFPTPLGWFDRFVLENGIHQQALDIKKGGIFPIVHGIRALALEHHLSESNTLSRIQALSGSGLLEHRFTADLIEAFEFMSMLRLRAQLADWQQGKTYHNYIVPHHLNKLEKSLLKDSFKIVNELKTFISYHFKLNLLT